MTRQEFMKEIHDVKYDKPQPAICHALKYHERHGEIDGQKVVAVKYGDIGYGPLLQDQAKAMNLEYVSPDNPLEMIKWVK